MRSASLILVLVMGCGSDENNPVIDAPQPPDAALPVVDADEVDCDGGCAGLNEVCGVSAADLDAGALPCGTGLVCCYPCGIPDCVDRCTTPCSPPGPGCQENGCPGPFP
jgi:hypothetical protein